MSTFRDTGLREDYSFKKKKNLLLYNDKKEILIKFSNNPDYFSGILLYSDSRFSLLEEGGDVRHFDFTNLKKLEKLLVSS